MADWFYIGYCTVMAMFAVAAAYAAGFGLRALRRLPRSLLLGFAAAAIVATLTAQKTNNVPPNMNSPLPQMQQGSGSFQTGFTGLTGLPFPVSHSPFPIANPVQNNILVQTTNADISRGWRVESVTTNAAVSYEMPTNAVYVGNWHIHGARSSFGNNVVDFGVLRTSGTLVPTNWSFPLGTNDEAFSAFWYFIDGRIRPTPRDAAHEICAVGVPMSAVPGQSRLWRLDGDDGSRVLTWENFFLGGDTNAPVNAQIVLCPNGDFVTRSNEVETVCRRVNPDDWDNDGIANERDANPLFCDGDFFGVANALPPNANPDAYYWLDLSVTGVLGIATIRVTCDGPSDLGDHLIVARTNEVCHIPLLAGATYAVESDLPIDYSAVSSEYAEIVTNAENHLTVSLPLELSLVRIQTRSAGSTGNYGASSSPINVYPSIVSCLGGCCLREVVDGILQWSCSLTCTCGGGYHSFETTALWEGYSKLFIGYASCGCWEDAPDPVPTPSPAPYAASVSANFSKDAVIFEDAYENMPGEWVSRRSTATMLTISASGGTNGAVLSVSATNLGKLQKNSGPAFPAQSVSVPARQSITYAMNYVGLSASGTADDIEIVATLVDNVTGESITNDCQATSVRLELAAVYEAPENPCTNRHVYGVGEKVRFLHYPESLPVTLIATKGDVGCDISYYDQFGGNIDEADKHRIYVCPIAASYTPNPTISYVGVPYTPLISLVEPQAVITPEVSWESCHDSGDVGQSILITTNYISPMTVSFQGIMVAEIPCTETNTPTGYFATTNFTGFMTHSIDARAGLSRHIQERNRWTIDRAGGGLYRNWSAGQLTWNIPIGWGRLMSDRDTFGSMPVPEYEAHTNSTTRPLLIGGRTDLYTQTFQIDEDGTARIDKFGHWLSRGRYCRIILDGKTVQWTHPLW